MSTKKKATSQEYVSPALVGVRLARKAIADKEYFENGNPVFGWIEDVIALFGFGVPAYNSDVRKMHEDNLGELLYCTEFISPSDEEALTMLNDFALDKMTIDDLIRKCEGYLPLAHEFEETYDD